MATSLLYACGHGGAMAFSGELSELRLVALVAFAQAGPCPGCAARGVGTRARRSAAG